MTHGKRKKNILDEDQYLDDLEYIIKRDYFPDSELIELQLKYYDALDTQDFPLLKEIQLKLNKINQSIDSSKNTFEDSPHSLINEKPYKNPNIREERDLHLNEYLSRNTSEDNQSFSELQQKAIDRQLKKLEIAFKSAREYNEDRYKSLKLQTNLKKSIEYKKEKNYVEVNEPDLSSFMEYKVFNPLFFNPETAPLSKDERISLAGTKSQIIYENVQFKTPLYPSKKTKNIKSTLNNIPGKIGHDGKEIYDGTTPRIGGYSILARSPTPLNMTPEMTWGELGCTPQLLPDSPSQFKMQGPSEREKIANELASKTSRKNKDNKKLALQRVKSSLIAGGSSHKSYLTPAAMKLLSRITPYSPGVFSRPGSSLMLSSTRSVVLSQSGRKPTPNIDITDNLLDL